MYTLPLLLIIISTLTITLSKNGLGSFMTLGIFGAVVYTIPALINTQVSLATVASSYRGYVAVPSDVKFLVLMAWIGLLVGVVICSFLFPQRANGELDVRTDTMGSIAVASGILAIAGTLYLSVVSERILFFLAERAEQDNSPVALLWKWTVLIGLVSSTLSQRRKWLYFQAILLVFVFLRGDRTLVAIATAALFVTGAYMNPKWYMYLKPSRLAAMALGAVVVFFGKSIYLTLKSGVSGGDWSPISSSLKNQLLVQFEPLGTFSHIEYVMRAGVTISLPDFLESVFGNLLLVPSLFGISTNLYTATVTQSLSVKLSYGIAGNYLAHGYIVAGTMGAVLFYFILPFMLRLCDGQFRAKNGSIKVFWCCAGAVIAFYIHRNGLDNELSFVRQILIVTVGTAALASALRHFGVVGRPQGRAIRARPPAGLTQSGFTLLRAEAPPRSPPGQPERRPPASRDPAP